MSCVPCSSSTGSATFQTSRTARSAKVVTKVEARSAVSEQQLVQAPAGIDIDGVLRNNHIAAQRLSLWITPVVGAIFLVCFVSFPGFLPPMSPNMSADEVARFFSEHASAIRFSMVTVDLCGVLLLPFFELIVVQMKRMATPSHVFAYAYLSAVATGATLFAIPDLLWLIAAFRPERDPNLVVLLNDMAWIIFTAPVGMLVSQNILLALAVYMDARPRPVFPRWVAHFNLAIAAVIAPAAIASVVRSGPFAWNGLVSFWLKLGALAVYITVMFFVLRSAINRQALDEQAVS
jgi:hypothetical protein